MLIALLSLSVAAVLVYKILLYPKFFSPLRHLPGPSLGHPILGQLPTLHGENAGFIQKAWFKQYGPIIRVQAPIGTEAILLEDSNDIVACLDNQKGMQKVVRSISKIAAFVAGNGLLSYEDEQHDRLRKILNPAFSTTNLTTQMSIYYSEIISNFLVALDTGLAVSDTLPMSEYLEKVTLDILCKSTFSYDSGTLKNESKDMVAAYDRLVPLQNERTFAVLTVIDMIPWGLDILLSKRVLGLFNIVFSRSKTFEFLAIATESMKTIRRSALDILAENMSSESNGPKRDVMSTILNSHNTGKERDRLKTSELPDQILTFLTGGHETVTAALSWVLWFVATNPKCQSRLHEEVRTVSGGNDIEDYAKVQDLPYLNAVMYHRLFQLIELWNDAYHSQESMRLLPASPILHREVMQETEIRGVLLPKGTPVHLFVRNANCSKEIWGPDADEFRPERWENLPPTVNMAHAKLSFGRGYRLCIGRNMAIQEMKALTAALVNAYELSPAYKDQKMHAEYLLTYKPADGLPLRLNRLDAM